MGFHILVARDFFTELAVQFVDVRKESLGDTLFSVHFDCLLNNLVRDGVTVSEVCLRCGEKRERQKGRGGLEQNSNAPRTNRRANVMEDAIAKGVIVGEIDTSRELAVATHIQR